jgi:hypothetical protein
MELTTEARLAPVPEVQPERNEESQSKPVYQPQPTMVVEPEPESVDQPQRELATLPPSATLFLSFLATLQVLQRVFRDNIRFC